MDLSKATVEVTGLSSVRLCADGWIVDADVEVRDGRPVLVRLGLVHQGGINAMLLSMLPTRHITMIAANAVWGAEETIYRTLATPRPAGSRAWGADHYLRVWRVAQWAARSGRAGGPAVCVGQFWGVHERTARRWLAVASRVAAAQVRAAESDQSPA
jgi:hypothetical protein